MFTAAPVFGDRKPYKHSVICIKLDQLMSLALFFAAQHVSNASTFIFTSLRLCVGILLCKARVI